MEEDKVPVMAEEGVEEVEEVGMGDLALELLLHVMSYLEPVDLVRAEAVQRAWADALRHDNHTWRAVHHAHLGEGANTARASGSRPPFYLEFIFF
jgi:hypothetical protein